jgi:hypothetical protein
MDDISTEHPDFWTYHPNGLKELILDALETRNFEILRGIQCFSEASRWSTLEGMESIINTVVEKSVEMRIEADKLQRDLAEREEYYWRMGVYDAMQRRMEKLKEMKIPFRALKDCCLELRIRAFLRNVQYLEEKGFIETNRTRGGDDMDAWEASTIWLPRRLWDGILDDAIVRGSESSVYTSALGTMIAHAAQGKTISTLKAIVNALNRSKNGEMTHEELADEYAKKGLSARKMYNFSKRDAQKTGEIKAIASDDGRRVIFSREMLLVNRLWRERTNELLRRRERGTSV